MGGPLFDVLARKMPDRRPIWLMRQAGRYLPEYRKLRELAGSFLDLCYQPNLAAEATMQPLHRFDLDAAILFSDILVVPHAMGLDLAFVENEGPVLSTVSSRQDVVGLRVDADAFQFRMVAETVAEVKSRLPAGKTLIGFCGAPWTVASYMIEGRSSDRRKAVMMAGTSPDWFVALMEKLVDISVLYLNRQIAAGAEVVQIFDSWAGDLPAEHLQRWVSDPIAAVVRGVRAVNPDFPVIVFARGVGLAHGKIAQATGASAVGVEQGVDIGAVLKNLPQNVAVQGNLDPGLLLGPRNALVDGVMDVIGAVPKERHIMNLGHGIQQQTDATAVQVMIDVVRRHDAGAA
jgi:uroporphyrinogen decarboxylase